MVAGSGEGGLGKPGERGGGWLTLAADSLKFEFPGGIAGLGAQRPVL